jgi:arabinogalactan oligomer/maltooligosaccharide transport system substrate-binding protein
VKSSWRITALVVAVAASALAAVAGTASAAPAAGSASAATTIRVWVHSSMKPATDKVVGQWASSRGVTAEVVLKEFGDIRNDLSKVTADTAPDVIVGAHDWTGELASGGLIVPLSPRSTLKAQFPTTTLNAFSYGTAVKRLYGTPVAVENLGLIVNTALAHVPTSFADLERQALAFKKKKKGNLALAVPGGDAYHMAPFLSGLGGYVFGKTRIGTFDPSDIGLDAPRFLANTPLIDKWNDEGLVSSKVTYDTAKNAFLKKQAAFWITGPWETNTLQDSNLRYRIVKVPAIKYRSGPFLGVQGFMVTKFASQHGVLSLAKDLVSSYLMRASAQKTLAVGAGRFPANSIAAKTVTNPIIKQFGAAGVGSPLMPNISQMAAVWSELAGAWTKSLKGPGATTARTAFTVAARNIANKIG